MSPIYCSWLTLEKEKGQAVISFSTLREKNYIKTKLKVSKQKSPHKYFKPIQCHEINAIAVISLLETQIHSQRDQDKKRQKPLRRTSYMQPVYPSINNSGPIS